MLVIFFIHAYYILIRDHVVCYSDHFAYFLCNIFLHVYIEFLIKFIHGHNTFGGILIL